MLELRWSPTSLVFQISFLCVFYIHCCIILVLEIHVCVWISSDDCRVCVFVAVLGHTAPVHSWEPATSAAFSERSDARHTARFNQPRQSRRDRSRHSKWPGGARQTVSSVCRISFRVVSSLQIDCWVWRWKNFENRPITRMWANAQRDGRPAEHRWRPVFNTAKFGWRPLLECRAVTMPRRETRWNELGCPKLPDRSQPLVGRSSPYYGYIWRRYCCLTSFFSDRRYVP